MRSWIAAVLAATLIGPAAGAQETAAVEPGSGDPRSLEIHFGVAGITLPEGSDGTYSAQPQLRVGLFVSDALQFQVEGYARIWPLGSVAATSYGVAGQFVWFPALGPQSRGLYLLGGVGGAVSEPPGRLGGESSFDPLVRGGVGFRVPLAESGIGFLTAATLNMEYRLEYLLEDPTDLVSGAAVSFAYSL